MSLLIAVPFNSDVLDSLDVRYDTLRDSAHNFLLTQVGVSVFQSPEAGVSSDWTCQTWNFYVFPRSSFMGDKKSKRFLCQASSLEFLSEHNFDFNKFIGEGISYLPLCDVPMHEERIRAEQQTTFHIPEGTRVSAFSLSIFLCYPSLTLYNHPVLMVHWWCTDVALASQRREAAAAGVGQGLLPSDTARSTVRQSLRPGHHRRRIAGVS